MTKDIKDQRVFQDEEINDSSSETHGTEAEDSTAAAAELMATLTAGEVKAAAARQTEDELTAGTLNAAVTEQGGVTVAQLVLLLPESELVT